jgi:hypothetical protein
MQYKSQREAVLAHLKEYGSITSIQAIHLYGATRLSAIIYDLRHKGYRITSEPIQARTRFGRTTRPAKYILENAEK